MKRVALVVVGLGLFAAPAAFADGKAGADLFEVHCKMCHGEAAGPIPALAQLKTNAPQAIVEKLTDGSMAPMAAALSDADKRDIAVFLSGKPLPAAGKLPAVKP